MVLLALLTRNEIFWWVAIGVGFAVVAIVVALLMLVLATLKDAGARLSGVGGVTEALTGEPEAGGTAAVDASSVAVEALRAEVRQQRRLLPGRW